MSRPLQFLHVTTFYPPYSFGGDAVQVYRLAHALADAGHHVDVLHCCDSFHLLHPGEPPVQFAEHPLVTRHELRSGYGWISPLLSHQTGRAWLKGGHIREVLRERAYDVIHYHNISLLGPEVLAFEPAHGQAVKMYTMHEHWLVCPMHVLWKFDREPCQQPECIRCSLQGKRPPQIWRHTGLLERMSGHVDQFLAPSRFTARMHAERGFRRPAAHLPHFTDRVDSDWQHPVPRPQQTPYFLAVSRLERFKGLQTLIALWPRAPQHDLLIAGEGAFGAELHAMAAGNPRIRFLGALSQQELGGYYYHAAACLIPSMTYETFGLTSVEAFARKTPVIARDLGALPELVRESGGGMLYRTDDELLEALHTIASPPVRAELGEKGYAGFEQWWCREAHLRQYFDLLAQAAEKKFGRVPWRSE